MCSWVRVLCATRNLICHECCRANEDPTLGMNLIKSLALFTPTQFLRQLSTLVGYYVQIHYVNVCTLLPLLSVSVRISMN